MSAQMSARFWELAEQADTATLCLRMMKMIEQGRGMVHAEIEMRQQYAQRNLPISGEAAECFQGMADIRKEVFSDVMRIFDIVSSRDEPHIELFTAIPEEVLDLVRLLSIVDEVTPEFWGEGL